MTDIFGFLGAQQWLAILRIAIGLWWIQERVVSKPLREFVSGQMAGWTLAFADQHPFLAYARMIRGLVTPEPGLVPLLGSGRRAQSRPGANTRAAHPDLRGSGDC